MYLQRLEIQGFKSFANKVTLEFNRELTAVVGPNGSGKSNVADAVRWVLGEQSLKVLRSKKSQDVIFAGSDQKARLGFAEVNLYLNNEDESAPIDYHEIVITRRVYRDGESEYLINKNKVRLQDIQMLIAKSSFGQRSYSIVGQGMVDSILTSSPQERKEFFDEATGVRQYQIKREQALNKLEHTYDNLTQSEQLLKEIEPRLKSLSRQMKRLEEREETSRELTKLQSQYYGFLTHQLQTELTAKNSEFLEVERQRQEIETRLNELQKELEKIEAESGRSQAFREIENKYSRLVETKNRLLQELSLLRGKLDLELTASGQSDLVWLQKKSADLALQLTAIQEQLENSQTEKKKIEDQLNKKLAEQGETLREFDVIKEKLLNIQKENGPDDNLTNLQDKIISLQDKYRDFLRQLESVDSLEALNALKATAAEIATIINVLSHDLKQAPLTDAREITYLEEKMNQFLTSKDNLVDEINELKINLEITKTKQAQAEEHYRQTGIEKEKIEAEIKVQTADSPDAKVAVLEEQKQHLEAELSEIQSSLELAKEQIDEFNRGADAKQSGLIQMQKQTRELQIKLNEKNNTINQINVEVAKLETKLEDLNEEIGQEMSNDWRAADVIIEETLAVETVRDRISSLKNKLALVGGIDETVPQEYSEVKERFNFLDEQTRDLNDSIASLQEAIKELDAKIEEQFRKNFNIIKEEFEKYFRVLFNGGKASLTLKETTTAAPETEEAENDAGDESTNEIQDSPIKKLKNTFSETEIDIKASPPGKKIDSINTLSGGEKAMTAIALICAIISANPSPFVILDEVDAALDEANAGRYVAIINELSNKTQFIAITHNRVTMHHASILYGVTMGSDSVSRILSVNLKEAEEYSQ